MIPATHKKIACEIYHQLDEMYPIKILDKKNFIYGNIKPDFNIQLRKKSHKIKDSLGFVVERMNKVLISDYRSLKDFSIELGVINHFIADFFCSAHFHLDSKVATNIVHHILYEIKLDKAFHSIKNSLDNTILQDKINAISTDTLASDINYLSKKYSQYKPSIKNDIQYALTATRLFSIYLVYNSYYINELILKYNVKAVYKLNKKPIMI